MKNVYSVFDELSGFMGPVVDINDSVATRNFSYMISNSKEYAANAKDYSLYFVGEFDEKTGLMSPCTPPKLLMRASDCINGEDVPQF